MDSVQTQHQELRVRPLMILEGNKEKDLEQEKRHVMAGINLASRWD